jgi:heat shock protein HslJ
MKNVFYSWSFFLLVGVLTGCSTSRSIDSETQEALLSGSWEMAKWTGYEAISTAFPQGLPVLVINTEELTVNGSNGCNSIMGKLRYDREAATIQFYEISSTKMFCQTVPENEFHQALGSVNSYRVTQENLFLLKGTEEVMVLNRQEVPQ